LLLGGLLCACAIVEAQQPEPAAAQLNESGEISVAGHESHYLIRHLPVSSFPGLPAEFAAELNRRGCLIPQSYQAHGPENVVHASLERAGSSDWAALCTESASEHGTVSLLVYFASAPKAVQVLAAAPETERLQAHGAAGVLGFDWGIDAASPKEIYDAQAGMKPRPKLVEHDALADSIIDHGTVYHYYAKSAWTTLETPE
jgi:hypothetical protein